MSNLALTLVLSFVLIVLSLIGIGIGWLLTGQCRTRHCGSQSGGQAKDGCDKNISCSVCKKGKKEEKEDDETQQSE